MRILLLDPSFKGQRIFEIKGKDAHYLCNVLRLPIGQRITARDTAARLWSLRLIQIRRGACVVETCPANEAIAATDALPECGALGSITLYQCVTKQKKLEQIVRQATEIGVSRIVLVKSRFSCSDPVRQDRLDAQIKEAIQQSGSLVPTCLSGPISMNQVPADWEGKGQAVFLHQTSLPGQRFLGDIAGDLRFPAAVLIGSEGGLDKDECGFLSANGFEAALLETNILRAETAAVYALAIVQSALQGKNRP